MDAAWCAPQRTLGPLPEQFDQHPGPAVFGDGSFVVGAQDQIGRVDDEVDVVEVTDLVQLR